MNIRKATIGDFDKIYPIYMDETVNPYMGFPVISKSEFLAEIFKDLIGTLYMQEDGNDILAVIVIDRLKYRRSHVVFISKLAINPVFHSKGLGTKLLANIVDSLREEGIKRIELVVESDNIKAISFYEKMGFKIEGTMKDYFNREGEMIDDHIMTLLI